MDQLNTLEIGPVTAAATSSVIWMHGLGASAHDFEPVVPHMQLPNTRFVLPNAPSIPVTLNGGYVMPAWYDILTLEPGPHREDPTGIERSAGQIRQLIAREVARGVPEDRILLVGFSQGAAMALYTGLTHPRRLAGIAVLSGYLLLDDVIVPKAANASTPIFFGHGAHDPVVPMSRGRHAHDALTTGHPLTWREYPMAHEVCLDEIANLRQWMHGLLDRKI